MNTGPKAESGFDIALTEVVQSNQHYFVAEAGSEKGEKILSEIPHEKATEKESKTADAAIEKAAKQMGRQMDTTNIKELLYENAEDRHWDEIAQRCLTCANCTIVCPTCFCGTVEDVTDLTGSTATRVRKWDSCFTQDFSYIHGGSVRTSSSARYRQWMTHKLASWIDQFGVSGCVGCGRCITWCPVGIDITAEVRFFQKKPRPQKLNRKELSMESLGRVIQEHPFFKDFIPEYIEIIAGCASLVKFDENHMIFKEGEIADNFYLVRRGKIGIEMYIPQRGGVIIDTVEEGEVLGWSWLFPPYQTHFDARAMELTRAIAFDGKCLRRKIDEDHNLGYHIMIGFVQIIQDRLQATRLKLIDMYGVEK